MGDTATRIYVPPVVYRQATAADQAFIYNSWLKSFRSMSSWAKAIPAAIYFGNHKLVVAKLLEDSGVLIAANPDDPEQIFGYAVYQPTAGRVAVLHWLYVKHPYRRLGIGTEIYRTVLRLADHNDELPVVGTHHTSLWDVLETKWSLVFNPYVMGADFFHGQTHRSKAG